MKLRSVRISNYRSVEDSTEFEIDDVTCLVGKNEAGKSAILLALGALNPDEATPITLDKERDYPRRNLVRYEQLHDDGEAIVASTTWELEDEDIVVIAEALGDGAMKSREVEVILRYGGEREVKASIDYSVCIAHFLGLFKLDAPDRSQVGKPRTTTELIANLNDLDDPSSKQEELRDYLNDHGSVVSQLNSLILHQMPTFMYVSSYDRMDGAIQIEQTRERISTGEIDNEEQRGSRLFVDFLEYAGVPIDEISDVSTYETFNAWLKAASTNITEQVLEYWSQNPDLDVEVTIDQARPGDIAPYNEGSIARARIKNNLHKVDTPFSERSAGFVWFFSFLVKFAQIRNDGTGTILLLDEPGLSLHGKAQADLLRFIDDRLAPSHQVLYSTHSPFMVPVERLHNVRIVEDRIDTTATPRRSDGTKVSQDVLMVDEDALFPLQGALGYKATQTLFIGEHTLLVEGPSDILYLQALSQELRRRKMEGLDPRWTLCPAGGIDKIMPFVSLFTGNIAQIAVLSDVAQGSKAQVQKMRESDVLRAGHFYAVTEFVDKTEADIEDLFDPEFFSTIVNSSFNLVDPNVVSATKLDEDEFTQRLVKKVERLFNVFPDDIPLFDHFTPADWLIRNPQLLSDENEKTNETLAKAEDIFRTFNDLLD
ncbi:MAG: AAA family ATPase [Gammaproteobacteria bacterium]|nr:AAA family ATPase [Gammaproteobacteria bacterium]